MSRVQSETIVRRRSRAQANLPRRRSAPSQGARDVAKIRRLNRELFRSCQELCTQYCVSGAKLHKGQRRAAAFPRAIFVSCRDGKGGGWYCFACVRWEVPALPNEGSGAMTRRGEGQTVRPVVLNSLCFETNTAPRQQGRQQIRSSPMNFVVNSAGQSEAAVLSGLQMMTGAEPGLELKLSKTSPVSLPTSRRTPPRLELPHS